MGSPRAVSVWQSHCESTSEKCAFRFCIEGNSLALTAASVSLGSCKTTDNALAGRHQRHSVVQTRARSRMLKHQRRMDQVRWRYMCKRFHQILAIKLQSRDMRIPPPYLIQICRINIESDHTLRHFAVDAIEPIPSGNSQNRPTPALAAPTPPQIIPPAPPTGALPRNSCALRNLEAPHSTKDSP